jgi:hypothetical protein
VIDGFFQLHRGVNGEAMYIQDQVAVISHHALAQFRWPPSATS